MQTGEKFYGFKRLKNCFNRPITRIHNTHENHPNMLFLFCLRLWDSGPLGLVRFCTITFNNITTANTVVFYARAIKTYDWTNEMVLLRLTTVRSEHNTDNMRSLLDEILLDRCTPVRRRDMCLGSDIPDRAPRARVNYKTKTNIKRRSCFSQWKLSWHGVV